MVIRAVANGGTDGQQQFVSQAAALGPVHIHKYITAHPAAGTEQLSGLSVLFAQPGHWSLEGVFNAQGQAIPIAELPKKSLP